MFFDFKKSFLKTIFLTMLSLMSLGSLNSVFAGYVQNGIFVGDNTKPYVRNAQYAPASSLFKSIKGKNTDKAFAQKYGKTMMWIIDGFLNTQKNMSGEKRQMLNILSNILKDHYDEYGTEKVSYSKPTVSNTYTSPKTSNTGFTPSKDYDSSNNLDNGFDDFFDSPSTSSSSSSSSSNNNFGGGNSRVSSSNSSSYSIDQLIKDTWVTTSVAKKWLEWNYKARCAFGDCWVLTRSNFSREIKVAKYLKNNIGIRESDSDDAKIVKIYNYINQHAEGKAIPFPYARGSPELDQWLAEHPEVRDGDRVLETWNGSCATLSSLYAEFLHLAGVDANIYYVGGMASNGQGGHGFLEINGRYSDVTNRWSTNNPFSWPSLEIRPDSISRHNV